MQTEKHPFFQCLNRSHPSLKSTTRQQNYLSCTLLDIGNLIHHFPRFKLFPVELNFDTEPFSISSILSKKNNSPFSFSYSYSLFTFRQSLIHQKYFPYPVHLQIPCLQFQLIFIRNISFYI